MPTRNSRLRIVTRSYPKRIRTRRVNSMQILEQKSAENLFFKKVWTPRRSSS
jgi:hypothetical protein